MDKAFDMIRDLVSGLTGILVGVIGLVLLPVLFLITMHGFSAVYLAIFWVLFNNWVMGIVGLLAVALLYKLLK